MSPKISKQSCRISAVIPAFNASHCLGRAIDSILAQSYPAEEIIVVDDGSTDDTAVVAKSYGEPVRYIYQDNSGASIARNTGVTAAKGDWIAFLDADDEWLPEKLQRQVEIISNNPELRWCSVNYNRTDGQKTAPVADEKLIAAALANRGYFESYFRAAAKYRFRADTPTLMIRREVFDELGGFEPGMVRSQDLDVWWRIAHHYPCIGYVAQPLAIIHLDTQNEVLAQRRLEAKRGIIVRELIARHLRLADEQNRLDEFRPFAAKELRESLLGTLFRGFKDDARETVSRFGDLFPWYWRWGTYVLTVLPRCTAVALQAIAYLVHCLGLERQVTRRWKQYKPGKEQHDTTERCRCENSSSS